MSTIAERFKEIRLNKRMTQAEYANSLEIKRQVVANIEIGHSKPTIDIVQKCIEEFNVNANWLLAGVGEMFIPQIDDENPQLEKMPCFRRAFIGGVSVYWGKYITHLALLLIFQKVFFRLLHKQKLKLSVLG